MNKRTDFKALRLAVALVVPLLLAGCGNTFTGGSSDSGGSAVGPGVVSPEKPISGEGVTSDVTTPSVIRTGSVTIESPDVHKAFVDGKTATTTLGGSIQDSYEYADASGTVTSATFVARVPEAKFDAAMTAFAKLGTAINTNSNSSDVTLQVVDLQAKVDALDASVKRLKELMAKATNTADLIAAESALAERQAQLDSYRSQLTYLKDQVAMSTISVQINRHENQITTGLMGFGETFTKAAHYLLSSLQALVVFIGAALPWLVLGIPAIWILRWVLGWLRRLVQRRRK